MNIKYWHYNLCQCYFEEDKNSLFIIICVVAKFPKDIVPVVPISVITSKLLKLHRLSTIPDQLRIGCQSRTCQVMIEWKQRVQKLRRFDVETTQKNPLGELINISSILEIKPTSKRCHNFHVDSPFKINEISANIQRGNSTLNRWQIDEYVSIGLQRA